MEDVEIYNNVFDQCNSGGLSQATFEIHATLGDPDSEIAVHRNVRIHHNRIVQVFKPLMIIDHVENIEFFDNEIVPGPDYPMWWKGRSEPPHIIWGLGVKMGRFCRVVR